MPTKSKTVNTRGTCRIIGGRWRGRKLTLLDTASLRPTADRTRETLFNWLSPIIQQAHCLDCFAGSGALGFEALSRGAKHVTMLEKNPALITQLSTQADRFDCHPALRIIQATLPAYWAQLKKQMHAPFDIVFLDPPFHQNLIPDCLHALTDNAFVHTGSTVYVEIEKSNPFIEHALPIHWQVSRSGYSREVAYYLLTPLMR